MTIMEMGSVELNEKELTKEELENKELLDETVFNIVREEMRGRGVLFNNRNGPRFRVEDGMSMYDFIRVNEPAGDSRLILVLFNSDNSNWWYPEGIYENQTMYPIGTDKGIVYEKFRRELEAGKVPDVVFVQTQERDSQHDDRRWDFYQTICYEVRNQEQVAEVYKRVQGLKTKEILDREPEEVEEILARIENDDSLVSKSVLKFDYFGISEDQQSLKKYWGSEDKEVSPDRIS